MSFSVLVPLLHLNLLRSGYYLDDCGSVLGGSNDGTASRPVLGPTWPPEGKVAGA